MQPANGNKRVHVVFSGRVQGVGFRYLVCRIAEESGVVGFVRNLDGGDVELVAEGSADSLSDMLHRIRNSHLKTHIQHEQTEWNDATGEFHRFGVSFQ